MENGNVNQNYRQNPFRLKERGSSLGKEILGGIVLFLVTCYILPANSGMLSRMGMDPVGIYASTALVTALATAILALVANSPLLLSAGMGLNGLLVSAVAGFSWQEGMIIAFLSAALFFILSVTPARKAIIEVFPNDLKRIISVGLGCFLAFVGLNNGGLVVSSESNIVSLGDLTTPSVFLALLGIIIAMTLTFLKTKRGLISSFAIPISMAVIAIIGVILYVCGVDDPDLPRADLTSGWGIHNLEKVFLLGVISNENDITNNFGQVLMNVIKSPVAHITIFTLAFSNIFNVSAVLMATGRDCELIDEEGRLTSNRPFIADSVAGLFAPLIGTSNTTLLGESASAIKVGARTGIAALVAAFLFLLSSFAYPLFEIFSYGCVTCCVLVTIGGLIFVENIKDLDWKLPEVGFSCFLTILIVLLTNSLTNGIGFGLIGYVLIKLVRGKGKEMNWLLYVVAALFLVGFVVKAAIANA